MRIGDEPGLCRDQYAYQHTKSSRSNRAYALQQLVQNEIKMQCSNFRTVIIGRERQTAAARWWSPLGAIEPLRCEDEWLQCPMAPSLTCSDGSARGGEDALISTASGPLTVLKRVDCVCEIVCVRERVSESK